jgi:hypothetical protein
MLTFAYAKNIVNRTNSVHEENKEQDIHTSANQDHLNTAPSEQGFTDNNHSRASSTKSDVYNSINTTITPPVAPKKPSATSIFDNPHLNILYNNRTAILAVIGSITLILFPQIVMSLVALHPITCVVTALYLMAIYAISRGGNSDESAYGLFQYMHDLTYYGNSYPQLIAITAFICLFSTSAPLNFYFSYRMMQALMGNSLSDFKIANQCYLAYILVRCWFQRYYCKTQSQKIGARQGGDMQELRRQQESEHKGHDFEGQDMAFQDASKLTSSTWYFIQTCMQAGITMVSSLNAMVNFSLPATLSVARRLLMIRTTATAVSFTLLTYISSAWAAKAKGELNDLKYATDEGLRKNPKFPEENNRVQENQAIASTIQDSFYDIAKNLMNDSALTLFFIIVAIEPAFPLGATITVAQVTALASVLSRMTIDFLSVARNMGAYSDADSIFKKLSKTFGFSDGQLKTADKDITIDLEKYGNGGARSYARRLMQDTYQYRLDANTVKARIQNVTDALAFIALAIAVLEMTTTPLIGLGLTPAFMSACAAAATYHVVSTMYNVLTSADSANNSKRMSVFACNFATSALIVRLASMFVPQHILGTLSYLGVSAGLAPQLACLGIITNLVMTLFITPLFMQQKIEKSGSTKDSAHEVFNDYTKLVVEPISAVYRKSNDLIKQVSNAQSRKLGKDDNWLARIAGMVPTLTA